MSSLDVRTARLCCVELTLRANPFLTSKLWRAAEDDSSSVLLSLCSCSEGSVHHTVAEVVRFVEERIQGEDGKESRSLRGPYLARLELIHRLRERGCAEERLLGKNTLCIHLLSGVPPRVCDRLLSGCEQVSP